MLIAVRFSIWPATISLIMDFNIIAMQISTNWPTGFSASLSTRWAIVFVVFQSVGTFQNPVGFRKSQPISLLLQHFLLRYYAAEHQFQETCYPFSPISLPGTFPTVISYSDCFKHVLSYGPVLLLLLG